MCRTPYFRTEPSRTSRVIVYGVRTDPLPSIRAAGQKRKPARLGGLSRKNKTQENNKPAGNSDFGAAQSRTTHLLVRSLALSSLRPIHPLTYEDCTLRGSLPLCCRGTKAALSHSIQWAWTDRTRENCCVCLLSSQRHWARGGCAPGGGKRWRLARTMTQANTEINGTANCLLTALHVRSTAVKGSKRASWDLLGDRPQPEVNPFREGVGAGVPQREVDTAVYAAFAHPVANG